MGIEPASEAWEACYRSAKMDELAAIWRFSKFLNGFQLEQRSGNRHRLQTAESQRREPV